MHRTSNKLLLLLALLLCLAGRGFAATALGSITITGAEQSSGGTWDSGTVTATINGVSVSFAYGQYTTPSAIASALGALISQKCSMPVYAKANGATLTLYQKGSNTISSASITSASTNPSLFSSSSFGINGGSGGWSSPQITSLSLSEGPPSMGLVIYGNNFAILSATVTIGGLPATVVPGSMTSTSVTVQVPPGLAPGNAVIQVSNGFPSNTWNFKVDTAIACP
jgi:hypothetical protein